MADKSILRVFSRHQSLSNSLVNK